MAGRWFYASQHIPNAGYKTYTVDFRKHHHAFGRTPRWSKFHRVPRCKSLKTPGCVRYRYRPATHQVRVGKRHGHLRKGKLRLAGVVYKRRHGVLPRGRKLKAKVAFMDWAGCDTVDFCGLWRIDLVLQRNGRFRANPDRGSSAYARTRLNTAERAYAGSTPIWCVRSSPDMLSVAEDRWSSRRLCVGYEGPTTGGRPAQDTFNASRFVRPRPVPCAGAFLMSRSSRFGITDE